MAACPKLLVKPAWQFVDLQQGHEQLSTAKGGK